MEVLPARFRNLPTNFSVKATLFKIVEVKYSKHGFDFKAALKKGPIKATMDPKGNVKFTGNVGPVSLRGDPVLEALGAKFKFLSVTFSLADNGDIKYNVSVSVYNAGSFSFSSQFDVEKSVLDRGFLKRAYDPVKNREKQLKDAFDEAVR